MFFFAILAVIAVIMLIAAVYAISIYNGLISYRNTYENAFSQIDVQLKRRYDLIPNLVETAKGYMQHERETLEAVINARNTAYQAGTNAAKNPGDESAIRNLAQAEGQLQGALSRLLMLSEQYPDLKANTNMLALQEELKSTENKVAFARQNFNDSVTRYNIAREQFPAVFVANMFNMKKAELFEVEKYEERQTPKVQF